MRAAAPAGRQGAGADQEIREPSGGCGCGGGATSTHTHTHTHTQVGEFGLLSDAPRSADVVALCPVKCLVLERPSFLRLVEAHGNKFLEVLGIDRRLRGRHVMTTIP